MEVTAIWLQGRVLKDSSYVDSTAPEAGLYAPSTAGTGRYNTSLDLAGYAVDNIRVATVEVFIDGVLTTSFLPNMYDVDAKANFPNHPSSSSSGFQKAIDISSLAAGAHTLIMDVYDTHNNKTRITSNFTKATSSSYC